MQEVLTAAEMREVDRLTTERYGIPSIILMENAAHAVARAVAEELGGAVAERRILILCGPGNNGGDGAALARILWTNAAKVTVLIVGDAEKASGDARANFDILDALPGVVKTIKATTLDEAADAWRELSASHRPEAVVDALFGTGLTRPLGDEYLFILHAARDTAHEANIPVIAVDLPSGMNSDGLEPRLPPLKADRTVTFTAHKPATALPPGAAACGRVTVADIGTPKEVINALHSQLFVSEAADASAWLKASRFHDTSYKNKRGHCLIAAGSESYSGAAVLAANAAMRSGVGLVTLAVPRSVRDGVIARVLPEVMVRGVSETESGTIAESAISEIADLLEKADSVLVGCGMDKDESTRRFLDAVISRRRQPVVVDADALNMLGASVTAESQRPPLIFTPHEGEFLRLIGTDDRSAIADRVGAVRSFAAKTGVILVLKGERALIAHPDGRVIVNPTGNSGLGKAGNGDTLAGLLAGCIAQAHAMNIDYYATVAAAVHVAGAAGDLAEKRYGKRVMTASDVRECLTEVFAGFEAG